MSILPLSIDDYFKSSHIGSINQAIGENTYGLDFQQNPAAIPSSREMVGFVFFTRPQLNLSDQNIRNVRKMYPLLTRNSTSIQMITRTLLDPRLITGRVTGNFPQETKATCPLVDNLNAFIPAYTNNIKAASGWPDQVTPVFTSSNGLYGEQYAQVDGSKDFNESYTIDCTFRNTRGDTILYTNYVWTNYQSYVFDETMSPYYDFVVENELDYTTRIWRITLDQNKNTVMKIAAPNWAFPINDPTGVFLDFNNEKPYNDQIAEFTIRFQCVGFTSNDEILIKEFNDAVAIFNPYMNDDYRSSSMVRVPREVAHLFNRRGYPRINPITREFEQWVFAGLFKQRMNAFFAGDATYKPLLFETTGGIQR